MLKILESLNRTLEAEIITLIDESYNNIQKQQDEWYKKSKFYCPESCGECCRNFEPDLLISEALYNGSMAYRKSTRNRTKSRRKSIPIPTEQRLQILG